MTRIIFSIMLNKRFFFILLITLFYQCCFALELKQSVFFNVCEYGAVSDGITDCSDAFQRAFDDLVKNRGGQLLLPKGNFLIKKSLKVATTDISFSVIGAGIGVTNIFCDNNEGFLCIRYLDIDSQITISNFSVVAMREGAGCAFDIQQLRKGNAHHRSLIVENIDLKSNNRRKDYFNCGFRIRNVWRPIFNTVSFAGPYVGCINDRSDSSPLYKADVAFDVSESYAPRFNDCYAWSSRIGYRLVDPDNPGAEDGALLNSYAVECAIGVDVKTLGVEPQLLIDGGHFNCRDYGLKIDGRKFITIVNCLFYNVDLDNQAKSYVDICLNNCNNAIISNNIFHFKGNSDRTNILLSSKSKDIIICSNIFNAHSTGIVIEKGCNRILQNSNAFAQFVKNKVINKNISK